MGRRGTSMAEGMNVVGLGGLEKVDVMSPAEECIFILVHTEANATWNIA